MSKTQTMLMLKEMAYHDGLTGLPNRRLFDDCLRQAMARARRQPRLIAVLFLDLDGFKDVNDAFGHGAGDLLLNLVGKRLKGCVRQTDTVARLGGDEFAVILDGVDHARGAVVVARKILAAVARPYCVDNHESIITASIGISFYPTDGADVETLIHQADLAMYHAKGQAKSHYQLYQPLNPRR